MRSLRSGVATAALALMWSGTAFGFNLFGSDDSDKPKPAPQTQSQAKPKPAPEQQQQQQAAEQPAEQESLAKTLLANLDTEIEKAKAQRISGDYVGAAHAFAQMVLVAPDNSRVLGEYGKTLVLLGRADDAIAFLNRAIQLQPNEWTYFSAIGAAYDQKNQFTDARAAYQHGLMINPNSAALLNNYAMSRMLAGDLPGAQALIAQAQAAGNDPKITHNAELMTTLRGNEVPHPIVSSVIPAAPAPVAAAHAASEPVKTAIVPAAPKPVVQQAVVTRPEPAKPIAIPVVAKPLQQAVVTKPEAVKPATVPAAPKPAVQQAVMTKPVTVTAKPVQQAVAATPEPVKPVAMPATPKPAVQQAVAVKPEPVKSAAVPAAPKPVQQAATKTEEKTASIAPVAKPTIVKTETGRVMMQAVPHDPEAGPVKTAEAAQPAQTETAATGAPRTLASAAAAAPVEAPRVTPDLRAASD